MKKKDVVKMAKQVMIELTDEEYSLYKKISGCHGQVQVGEMSFENFLVWSMKIGLSDFLSGIMGSGENFEKKLEEWSSTDHLLSIIAYGFEKWVEQQEELQETLTKFHKKQQEDIDKSFR